jgi:hypothetical protein
VMRHTKKSKELPESKSLTNNLTLNGINTGRHH